MGHARQCGAWPNYSARTLSDLFSNEPFRKSGILPETNRHRKNTPDGEQFRRGGIHRPMNPTSSSSSPRLRWPVATLSLTGAVLLLMSAAGCGRRPIIVQAPPPTVIQSPAPAALPTTTVIQSPATPAPTGRDVIVVHEAPPPPREEPPPPPPPSTEYKWVSGYWAARDSRQEWTPGHWEVPPRTSATWVAPRWERRGDGYVFIEGYWR